MRRTCALALFCLLATVLLVPGSVLAEEAASGFPYGKYTGSASANSGSGDPVAITLWLSDNGDGTVGISVSTPAVPFAFDANPATPVPVSGGYDLPVSVAYGSGDNGINGSGSAQLRRRSDGWYLWGTGSGTALGNSGSGKGSATLVSSDAGLADQFIGPIKDTFGSFTSDTEVAAPTDYPADEFADATPAPAEDDGSWLSDALGDDLPPNDAALVIMLLLMLVLMNLLGVVIW
jgi:hypothetical protein